MTTNNDPPAADQTWTGDVSARRVARIYAEALLNAAQKHGQVEEVLGELESLVRDVFAADSQLEVFLSSGAIGRNRKAEVIRSVFEQRAGEVLFNFLMVLNDHERLDLLRPILFAYRELRDERARRIRVKVQSAVPLPDDQRERLQQELREVFELEPEMTMQVNPDLLGGLVVRIGDWVYDASVRTQLETIRKQLIERSSHEIQSGRDRFSHSV